MPTGMEAKFSSAKISVWWHIDSCPVPKGCTIPHNIITALAKLNYCGPITITACGDTTAIPTDIHKAVDISGIALHHVPAGFNYAITKMLVDMLLWAADNPAPANYLLISGDKDFSYGLHRLRMRGYNILLAQPQPIKESGPLVAAANYVWHWTSLVYGGLPFTHTSENSDCSDTIQTSKIAERATKSPKSSNNDHKLAD